MRLEHAGKIQSASLISTTESELEEALPVTGQTAGAETPENISLNSQSPVLGGVGIQCEKKK